MRKIGWLLAALLGVAILTACTNQKHTYTPTDWEQFEKGVEAYEQGDYVTALKELRPLADRSFPAAQLYLGVMYDNGEGVLQDDAEAVKWYRLAAEQGDADAQYNLGRMHNFGRGVAQSVPKASEWYEKAAKQGHAAAQFYLGLLYETGDDYFLPLLSHLDDEVLASPLSPGLSKDYAEAIKWYGKAADQGHPLAQYFLAQMYERGDGVPRNYVKAYMWYDLSNFNAQIPQWAPLEAQRIVWGTNAQIGLQTVTKEMTPEEIAEAERLAGDWLEMHGMSR